jgi:hypothetical protein
VSEFLVEAYLSESAAGVTAPSAEDVSRVADQLTREGIPVQLLRSVFVREDETCFYLFRAHSSDAVVEAAKRCGLLFERLVEATLDWSPPRVNLES